MKRAFQILTGLIRNLKWKAVRVFVTHPLFGLITVWATVESVLLSEKNMSGNPDDRGLANAYRHAVWSALIPFYCTKFFSVEKSLQWTEMITDLHEELFPNSEFDRKMDLHNNSVGRTIFSSAFDSGIRSKKELLALCLRKTESGVALKNESDFSDYRDELVYYPEVE